jgi:multidrug efflux pump subunit AcrA (membrane-fusion protein)
MAAAGRLAAAQTPGIANVPHCVVALAEQADLPPQEAGVIQEILVTEGQVVDKGQLLVQLDDGKAQKEQDVAQAKYDAAKAKADDDINIRYAVAAAKVAKADYDINKAANALAPGAVSQVALSEKFLKCKETELAIEKATLDRKVAAQEALVAKAELEAAKLVVQRHKIFSPVSGKGKVNDIRAHNGEAVQPGQAIIHVVKLDSLWVEGNVPAAKYARSELDGQPVTVDVTIPGGDKKSFSGKVIFVRPLTDTGDTYLVRALVNNQQLKGSWLLYPGMQAEMNIELSK